MIFILSSLGCLNKGDNSSIQNTVLLKSIDFGSLQIKTPKNWRKLTMHGIDSYVGGITNEMDTLVFDYGNYSNNLIAGGQCKEQLYADVTVNGKVGYITKPKIKGNGFLGIYFGNIDREKFNLCTNRQSKNEDTIILIFQNITFKTSDTTRNTQVLKFAPKKCD